MTKPEQEHGTNSGYYAHLKNGTEPCDKCRKAHSEYVVDYRKNPKVKANEKARIKARARARTRLVKQYPDLYNAYYTEELKREGV